MADTPLITLASEGESRIEISKSIFIGMCAEVNTSEKAESFVAAVRAKYPDARHTCYAWRTTGNGFMQKYSDDGEPSGTGGMPILSVLEKKNINNAVITVTRYFGGILLGKGGLVRAYSESASSAVLDAGLASVQKGIICEVKMAYDMSEKLLSQLRMDGWNVSDIRYSDIVAADIVCPEVDENRLIDFVIDRSNGRVTPVKTGDTEIRVPIA